METEQTNHISRKGMINSLIGMMILVIVGLSVTYPVAKNTVLTTNFTAGTDTTLGNLVPTLVIVFVVVGLLSGLIRR